MAMSVEDDRQQLTPHVQNQQSSSEQAEGDRLLSNPNNRGPSPLGVAGKAV